MAVYFCDSSAFVKCYRREKGTEWMGRITAPHNSVYIAQIAGVEVVAAIIQSSVYSRMDEKPLTWLGSSLADLRNFPADARRQAGHELHQVQQGLSPSDWRPMSSVSPGVVEIRIHTEQEYRVFYVAKFQEAVYVVHAFEKKTQKTPKRDIDLARARYSELLRLRREQ